MPHEKFRADITNAIASAHEDGMTTKEVARLLRQVLYTVDMAAKWDGPKSLDDSSNAMPLTKGTEIRDNAGKLICSLARDIQFGENVRADQFTDWQISIPAVEMPRAIQRFIKSMAASQ